MNDVLALSLFLLLSHIFGRMLELLKLPALIGYILVGLILGPSVSNIIGVSIIEGLDFIGVIALGLIAFIIGSRIEIRALKVLRERVLFLTIFQALATFTVVSVGTYLFSHSLPMALLLGAISSATAPAAVFGVIEEYKSKGRLTNTLLAIVAIDDVVCLLLFGIIVAVVSVLTGYGKLSLRDTIGWAVFEVIGSLGIGAIMGFIIAYLTSKAEDIYRVVFIAVGFILLGCGLSIMLGLSVLLTSMMAGFVVVNMSVKSIQLTELLEKLEEPILILFFALAGAHLQLGLVSQVWFLVIVYIFSRLFGKILGVMLGARLCRASKVIQKYLGLGLIPQAGVAIGLVYIVKEKVPEIATAVIAIVLTSIVFNEIIGPIGVEIALLKSKEGKRPS